ncbi:DUF257 family protein [Thermococcus sp. JCM 11816]|uniref:DUF257 family protein n=1 Tax=Thermococcus sp. (strain JCM 11816 / KS-1) TaxID=1295125 RepID=UPI0006D1A0EC
MKFGEYLETLRPGESVLVEHTSISPYPVLFYEIGKNSGWDNILVIDIIDSALPVLRWLKFAGLDVPEKSIARIKAGGTSEWGGRIVIDVDPHKDPGIFMSKFLSNLLSYYRANKNVTTIIMNPPERIIPPLQDNRPSFVLYLANAAAGFLGNPHRKTFYFVNYELAHKGYLALLEEAFTRVLRMEGSSVRILKSLNLDEEGTTLQL